MTRVPFFYGWVIVAVCSVCVAVGYAAQHSFAVFFVAILEEFGWSRAVTAGALSAYYVVYGLYAVVAGGMVDRFGPRIAFPTGAVILGIGLLFVTGMSEVWQFYLLFGVVVGVGVCGFGTVPAFTVLNNWFVKKRGMAGGFATTGIGVGMFVLVPLLQSIIISYGWRTAYVVLAAIVLVAVPSITIVFLRFRPQEMGLLPDGAPRQGPASGKGTPVRADVMVVDRQWASRDWSLPAAVRTGRFWAILLARFLELLPLMMVFTHQAAYFVDSGFEKMLAASVVGFIGIVGSFGKIFWGTISDRIGREMSYLLAYSAGTVGIVALLSIGPTTPSWMLYGYGLIYGICYGASAVLCPVLTADVFHSRRFGPILGGIYVGGGLGSAVGAFLAGYIFDVTGSYTSAFSLAIPLMWTSCLLYWLAAPRKVRLVAGRAKKVAPELA